MTDTIASLAVEFNAQPYEVAAFADLGDIPQDQPLSDEDAAMIREAWEIASDLAPVDTATENRQTDDVLFALAEVVFGAGYDWEMS